MLELTSHDILTLAIGLVLGAVSAMFGIGGALVGTILLKSLLGMDPYLALATPLPAAVPSAVSGSLAYRNSGLVVLPLVWRIALAAAPMTFVGSQVSKLLPGWVLMVMSGGLLLSTSISFLRKSLKPQPVVKPVEESSEGPKESEFRRMTAKAWGGASVAGFMSGLLAIGGGMVLVPLFTRVFRLSVKSAIATSLACVALLSIPTIISHEFNGFIEWRTALLLCVTVVPSSWLTARFAARLRNRTVERIYGVAMLVLALYFIADSLVGLGRR